MAAAGCISQSGNLSLTAGSSLVWPQESIAAVKPCIQLRRWRWDKGTISGLRLKEIYTRIQNAEKTSFLQQRKTVRWKPLRCTVDSPLKTNQSCLVDLNGPEEANLEVSKQEPAKRTVKADLRREKQGLRIERAVGQALLAAYLVSAPFTPPPAEALQLQVPSNANIVGAAAKQAATLAKTVQQNKIFEQAAEQMELQARSLLSPEVHDFLNQTREYLHIPTTEAISANIESGISSLEAAAEQLAAGVSLSEAAAPTVDSLRAAVEELATGVSAPAQQLAAGVSGPAQQLVAGVSDSAQQLAAGVSGPAFQRLRETVQQLGVGELDELVGSNLELLREKLRSVQGGLTAFQESVASGDRKLNEPMQQALGNAQDSVTAALKTLEKVAGDALNLIPIRSPSLPAAAQATIERLGMFELFGLVWGFIVTQGERLVIFGPGLLLLAAGWNAIKKRQRERRRLEKRLQGPSPAARLRSVRVQRALLKLQVKGQLFGAVRRLGKAALASTSDPATPSVRQEVEALIKQLLALRTDPEPALLGTSDSDPFADLLPAPDIDGKWQLVYSTEPLETRGLSPGQFAGLLPDFVMADVIQRVTSREQGSLSTGVPQPAPVRFAENSASVSFQGVGTFAVSVHGRWEDHENDAASLSFDSFSAHPLELFGKKLDGVPQVQLPVPTPLQQSVEWSTVYIDEDTRISQSKRGSFYLFKRLPG